MAKPASHPRVSGGWLRHPLAASPRTAIELLRLPIRQTVSHSPAAPVGLFLVESSSIHSFDTWRRPLQAGPNWQLDLLSKQLNYGIGIARRCETITGERLWDDRDKQRSRGQRGRYRFNSLYFLRSPQRRYY